MLCHTTACLWVVHLQVDLSPDPGTLSGSHLAQVDPSVLISASLDDIYATWLQIVLPIPADSHQHAVFHSLLE